LRAARLACPLLLLLLLWQYVAAWRAPRLLQGAKRIEGLLHVWILLLLLRSTLVEWRLLLPRRLLLLLLLIVVLRPLGALLHWRLLLLSPWPLRHW
jgi:hypothetical protein